MKQRKRIFIIFALLIAVSAITLTADSHIMLPGVNAEDKHPNGCIDCHSQGADGDYRLNVSLKELSGHPPIDAMVKTLPNDCMTCHKAGAYAGPLSSITHKSHYANPGENHFVSGYGGQCLECHSLNLTTGAMSVKSGPKNW